MSRPPLNPEKSVAGIIVDPHTLERVIPESRRPDGSVRKQLKVRPGFTPQEDVKRFRSSRQVQIEANALPKGHIIGWVPPSSATPTNKPLSKSAKKNAKRKEKREEKKAADITAEPVPESWEDDDDEETAAPTEKSEPATAIVDRTKAGPSSSEHTADKPNGPRSSKVAEKLASELAKLNLK